MKTGVLKSAWDLIEYSKRAAKEEPNNNIMQETNRLEKEFF